MTARMQQRRGTAAQWTAANPILADGEIGLEKDTGRIKIGDGATPWNTLVYGLLDANTADSLYLKPETASATYRARLSEPQSITYNADGTVATVTETDTGATLAYTYNADGTPATEARTLDGVTTTRTFTYTSGNLTGVA